jgi:hypothetical protein
VDLLKEQWAQYVVKTMGVDAELREDVTRTGHQDGTVAVLYVVLIRALKI